DYLGHGIFGRYLDEHVDVILNHRAAQDFTAALPGQFVEYRLQKAAYLAVYSSKHGENVLDLFGGSGSTLIAAEQAGRKAFLMELDALYCDVIVTRWQEFTGKDAVLGGEDKTFDEMKEQRAA
ncbi:MAG: hypothetical protein KGI29_01620, partial [Pseudomonadota bacterium]|nr:hypothetical protein [Pseudomonadota bacterium]MDE3037738.1 hypothetical protein [Pseudomonadota bacterium]